MNIDHYPRLKAEEEDANEGNARLARDRQLVSAGRMWSKRKSCSSRGDEQSQRIYGACRTDDL